MIADRTKPEGVSCSGLAANIRDAGNVLALAASDGQKRADASASVVARTVITVHTPVDSLKCVCIPWGKNHGIRNNQNSMGNGCCSPKCCKQKHKSAQSQIQDTRKSYSYRNSQAICVRNIERGLYRLQYEHDRDHAMNPSRFTMIDRW